jgi:hypothetical protein
MTSANPVRPERRFAALVPALLIGLPLAAGLVALVHLTPLRDTVLARYLAHPVEYAEVLLFCAAVGLLTVKLVQAFGERIACRQEPLPPWDGRPQPVSEAGTLLATLQKLPARRRDSALGKRAAETLGFLCSRGSAVELDDHLRDLTDGDADARENSYGLVKFITWAIPILGFLGTVLGITEAIAGVNPEVLEKNLNAVTDGLATAFDTTAVALALTMVVMFYSFVVDKLEQGVARLVDDYAARQLAHRFERASPEAAPVLDALRHHGQVLLEAVDQLVRRQADVWAESLATAEARLVRQQQQFADALELAMSRSLEGHARQAAELQEQAAQSSAELVERMAGFQQAVADAAGRQQAALEKVAEGVAGQARVLGGLQAGELQLVRMQQNLDRNLHLLANAETLQQAVHTLTAAVHLLTARSSVEAAARPPGREMAA